MIERPRRESIQGAIVLATCLLLVNHAYGQASNEGVASRYPAQRSAEVVARVAGEVLDDFGRSIAFDGEELWVGSPFRRDPSKAGSLGVGVGAVDVFSIRSSGSAAVEIAVLESVSVADSRALFGWSVALGEDCAAVMDPNASTIHLFDRKREGLGGGVGSPRRLRRSVPVERPLAVGGNQIGLFVVGLGGASFASRRIELRRIAWDGVEGEEVLISAPMGTNQDCSFGRVVASRSRVVFAASAPDGQGKIGVVAFDEGTDGDPTALEWLFDPGETRAQLGTRERVCSGLALSNSTLVVGCSEADPDGATDGMVYVYDLSAKQVERTHVLLVPEDGPALRHAGGFGRAVAIDSTARFVAVGAPTSSGNAGRVFVFRLCEAGRSECVAEVRPATRTEAWHFGAQVVFHESGGRTTLLVAAPSSPTSDRPECGFVYAMDLGDD